MKPLAIAMFVLTPSLLQAAPAPAARQEIAHLVDYLKTSDCRFQRNGSWHDAPDAARHLQRKLDYLIKRDLVATADEFIARAATASSVTGKPYQVRCGGAAAIPSATWLGAELAAFRGKRRVAP